MKAMLSSMKGIVGIVLLCLAVAARADEFKPAAGCAFMSRLGFLTRPKRMLCSSARSRNAWWDWRRVYTIVGCHFECFVVHDISGNCINSQQFLKRATAFQRCMNKGTKKCQKRGQRFNVFKPKGRFKREKRQLECAGRFVKRCARGQEVVLDRSTIRFVPKFSPTASPTASPTPSPKVSLKLVAPK